MDKKKEFEKEFCYAERVGSVSYELLSTEKLWTWIDQAITDACKRQRQICADEARIDSTFDHFTKERNVFIDRNSILNSPSPTEGEVTK